MSNERDRIWKREIQAEFDEKNYNNWNKTNQSIFHLALKKSSSLIPKMC